MGLVKISEQMHANLRSVSAALSRSINAQAEHWMRIGMLAELHPTLNYGELCQLLIRGQASGVTDLNIQPSDLTLPITQARAVSQ